MDEQLLSCENSSGDVYDTNILGGLGEKYNRLIALRLLTRATFEKRPFKLAIEFKGGDKFDDVAFYNESAKEWWLFQAKHSVAPKDLTCDAMFPEKSTAGDFVMAKYFMSYFRIRQHWRYGGEKIRFFIFTNNRLHKSVNSIEVSVDEMLQFSEGEHAQLLPTMEDVERIKRYILQEMCDLFLKLFVKGDGRAINVLENYPKLVQQVLTKDSSKLKFSKTFLQNNPESEFYGVLKSAFGNKDMATLSVNAPAKLTDFWSETIAPDNQQLVDDDTVREFFSNLVLSFLQPNVKKLAEQILCDWNRWMKGRIRPDVLRRMTADQLKEPFNTFEMCFEQWEEPYKMLDNRRFMTHEDGVRYLNIVKDKLNRYVSQYDRQDYVGLDAAENYYVNRLITFGKREKSIKNMKDLEFVKWLCKDQTDNQCFALLAEPGMGKSTLWQHLAFDMQRNYMNVEVFLIYLNDLKDSLQVVDKNSNIEDAVQILRTVISDENMKPLLNRQQKVVMFMDAFDELREEHKQSIFSFINVLKESRSNVEILISSREHSQNDLEKIHQIQIMDVVPFDDSNRRDFLKSFWKVKETDTEKFDAYAKQLLDRFEHDVPRGDINFIGLPLTMKMLAEAFEESFMRYMKSPISTEPESMFPYFLISICFLYERFTRKCILLSLNKNWKLDINAAGFTEVFESIIKSTDKNFQLFAMEQLEFGGILEESHKTELNNFRDNTHRGRQDFLLLRTVNGDTQFTHRSYAEYYCAKYLYDQFYYSETIQETSIEDIITRKTVVRKFFLQMLDMKCTPSSRSQSANLQKNLHISDSLNDVLMMHACIDNCVNLLSTAKNVDKLRLVNGIQSTLLHVSAESNACKAMEALLKISANINVENEFKYTALCVACENGHLDMVKLLVEKGANVNHRLGELEAPLNIAAGYDHLEIFSYLIMHGAKVNPDSEIAASTPLHTVALRGNKGMLELLCSKGVAVDATNSQKQTALHVAVNYGRIAVVETLLNNGANINALDEFSRSALNIAAQKACTGIARLLIGKGIDIEHTNSNGWTALHTAAYSGKTDVVEELLKCGAHIDSLTESSETILHLAAKSGVLETVRLLIEKGVDVHLKTVDGRIASHGATCSGNDNSDWIEWLLKSGAYIDNSIESIAKRGILETVLLLIEKGADLYPRRWFDWIGMKIPPFNDKTIEELLQWGSNIGPLTKSAETALHFAVRLLNDKGVNVNLDHSFGWTALHTAASNGKTDVVDELLKCGANIDTLTESSETALHLAARSGVLETVRLLIEKGVDGNLKTVDGRIALHEAARNGKTDVVEELLKCGASIGTLTKSSESALHFAARSGVLETVRLLIEKGADVQLKCLAGWTALHEAARNGKTDVVDELLKCGSNIGTLTESSETALHFAAGSGVLETVRLLIEKGVDVHLKTTDGRIALHEAARNGKTDVVEELLKCGSNIGTLTESSETALHFAAGSGVLETVRLLIEKGVDVHLKTTDGRIALHEAARNGKTDVVEELLKCGSNIGTLTKSSETALHFAAGSGVLETVRLLIEKGVDVHLKTEDDKIALHEAARSGKTEVVEELLKCGASIGTLTKSSESALHFAARSGGLETVRLLMEKGADVHLKCLAGWTALHKAAFHGNTAVVEELLKCCGANIDILTESSETALHFSIGSGVLETVRVLIEKGADVHLKNLDGRTALDYAVSWGRTAVIEELLKGGVNYNEPDERGTTPQQLVTKSNSQCIIS